MPQSMEIQYSRANIKGNMRNFMKNSEISSQTNFLCRIQYSYLKNGRKCKNKCKNFQDLSIQNRMKRLFLDQKILIK